MMQQDVSTKQLLAEINMDLSVPLHIKLALKEFELDVRRVLQEQSTSATKTQTLLEFTHLTDVTALRNAFKSLPTVDVNQVQTIVSVIKPNEVKVKIPQGLISAISNLLTKSLAKGFDKIPGFSKGPQWIATRRRLLRMQNPALLAKLDNLMAIGGKISSIVFIVASALAIMVGLPIPSPIITIGGSLLVKLAADMAQGKSYSEALANFTKNVGVAIASGWAVNEILSGIDSAWPAIKDFVTSSAEKLGITSAQAQAVAQAPSLDSVADYAADTGAGAGASVGTGTGPGGVADYAADTGAGAGASVGTGTGPGGVADYAADTGAGAGAGVGTGTGPGGVADYAADTGAGAGAGVGAGAVAGGQVITIPQNTTLSQLAQQYKVSVDDLMQANRITDPDVIKAGNQLVIPPETGKPIYDRGVGLPRTR